MITTPNPRSPHHRKSRLSAPQLQAQLSLLCDRTRLRRKKHALHTKGAWQQVTRIQDLCHTHVLQWLYRCETCGCGQCPHTPQLHHQRAKEIRLRGLWLVNAVHVGHTWSLNLSTLKPAAPLKPPEVTTLAFTPISDD